MPVMTVYVARAGTPLVDNPTPSRAGHIWYSLSSDGTTEQSYGFAPVSHGTTSTEGQVYRNDVENYTQYAYRKAIFITQAQYDTLKSFGDNPESKSFIMNYDVLQNSCVDFVYKALGLISPTLGGYEGRVIPSWNIQDQKLRAIIEDINTRNAVDPPPDPSHGDLNSVGAITVSIDGNAAYALLGHDFDPRNPQDIAQIEDGIDRGIITASVDYGPDRTDAPFENADRRLVLSSNGSESTVTLIQDNQIKRISLTNNDGSGKDTRFDPENTHPYGDLEISTDPTGGGLLQMDDYGFLSGSLPADVARISERYASRGGRFSEVGQWAEF